MNEDNEDKFLYYLEKKELENNIEIFLYYFDKDKNIIVDKKYMDYEIKIKESDVEIFLKTLNFDEKEYEIKNKNLSDNLSNKINLIKINSKENFLLVKEFLKNEKVKTYELDLPLEHKYLIDNKVEIAKKMIIPKFLILDIETINLDLSPKFGGEICMISALSNTNDFKKVYVSKDKTKKEILDLKNNEYETIICENEKDLLIKFQKDVIEFSPQIMLGWNVINFDFKVIYEKLKKYKLSNNFSKYLGNVSLRVFSDFFKTSTLKLPGMLVFDIIDILKINFINFPDFKLDTVAKEILGDNKIEIHDEKEEDKMIAINNLYLNDPNELAKYCFKDSELCLKILDKLKLIELILQRSIITATPLNKIQSPIATLDIMYLKKLRDKNKVAKSNFNFTTSSPITGAFVLTPKPNFYKNIFVFDFKSLYPNIMRTFNIDPFNIDEENGEIESPNGLKFSNKEKPILSELLQYLSKTRDIAKLEKDNIKQNVVKITMNSFYGAVASAKSRYYNKDLGEAITGFGRDLIQKTGKFISEKFNSEFIYGDTDSCFIELKSKEKISKENHKKIGKDIENDINEFVENYSKQFNSKENFLKIEFEKVYDKFFIASKKRYVGHNLEKDKLDFVGLQFVRGDWTKLAKNFQKNLVDLIFENLEDKKELEKNLKIYILDMKKKLFNKEFDKDLIYYKKLTKPLSEYTKTTPPHVKAARLLKDFDKRLVRYIISEKGPIPLELVDKNTTIDYNHYLDKQLTALSVDLLEPLNLSMKDIIYFSKQKSLNSFF